jgi:hypothetical protein
MLNVEFHNFEKMKANLHFLASSPVVAFSNRVTETTRLL